MLSGVKLKNFKCFERLELNCAPLTLLCGMNGMGKSSILQTLLLLRQSRETRALSQERLVLGGDRVDLGTGHDVLFEDADSETLGIGIERNGDLFWELGFDCERGADLIELNSISRSLRGDPNVPIESPKSDGQRRRLIDSFLEYWLTTPPIGGRLIHVSADRLGPRKMYPLSDVRALRSDFGPGGEYAWNYLAQHQRDRFADSDPRKVAEGGALIDVVDYWLQGICPGARLRLEAVRSADAVIPGYSFSREGDVYSNPYRAINVGFGLTYSLPVILGLLSARETLCLIENPEAHLHPYGQSKLAELAARAVAAGVQVIVETHSDHFMNGTRIAVRDGLIEPTDVAFHYFAREGNQSLVSTPVIDSNGRLSQWPVGFFDQHDINLAKLIA